MDSYRKMNSVLIKQEINMVHPLQGLGSCDLTFVSARSLEERKTPSNVTNESLNGVKENYLWMGKEGGCTILL